MARDEATGIAFETDEGVFVQGTQVVVEKISQGAPTYQSVKNILSGISDTFAVYDISALLNGAQVQPNGEVMVTFTTPDGYGNDVALYTITEDGQSEKINFAVSDDGKTLSAKLNKFSTYAICKLGTSNTEANTSSDTESILEISDQLPQSGNTLWIVIAIVATLLVAGAITSVIVIKKKNNPNE